MAGAPVDVSGFPSSNSNCMVASFLRDPEFRTFWSLNVMKICCLFFFKLKGIKTDKERKGEMQVEPKMTFFLKSTGRHAEVWQR